MRPAKPRGGGVSNSLAIAATTAALQHLLLSAAQAQTDLPGVTVTTVRPDGRPTDVTGPTVNVFLFQVRPNAALRNADVPTRDVDGRLLRRPQLALDLCYLLSFSGNDAELEPQRLLGTVVRALHDRPVLTRDAIRAVVDATAEPQVHAFLAASDLADQPELVRFSPLPLDLEQLAHLWSIFGETPYLLSIGYQASVVLIEATATPAPTSPVQETHIVVGTR
jgi:hypothetical protein